MVLVFHRHRITLPSIFELRPRIAFKDSASDALGLRRDAVFAQPVGKVIRVYRLALDSRCSSYVAAMVLRVFPMVGGPLDPQKIAVPDFRRSPAVCSRPVPERDVRGRAGRSPSRTTCGPQLVPEPTPTDHSRGAGTRSVGTTSNELSWKCRALFVLAGCRG